VSYSLSAPNLLLRGVILLAHPKAHIFEHREEPSPPHPHSEQVKQIFIQSYGLLSKLQPVC